MVNLIGKKVVVGANDFVQQELAATIIMIDVENKTVLLGLDKPLINGNTKYQHIVMSARLAKDDLDTLANNRVLGCTVTWVPESQFSRADPFDLSWWRGGAAAITDVSIT